MRIIAGKFKGRNLKTPKNASTRPTQGVVREAFFNICQGEIENANFLDLFAGSGAMGIEALSRGAEEAVFVEIEKEACRVIKENLKMLDLSALVIQAPVKKALKSLPKHHFSLIYADPPYHLDLFSLFDTEDFLNLLKKNALLFVETKEMPPATLNHFRHINSRKFGIAVLHQYQFSDIPKVIQNLDL